MHQLFEADGISKKGIKILDFTAAAANLSCFGTFGVVIFSVFIS